jgi:hypothetical protein
VAGTLKPEWTIFKTAMKKSSGTAALFHESALEKFPVSSKLRDGTPVIVRHLGKRD